jgi:hypothetical protein
MFCSDEKLPKEINALYAKQPPLKKKRKDPKRQRIAIIFVCVRKRFPVSG